MKEGSIQSGREVIRTFVKARCRLIDTDTFHILTRAYGSLYTSLLQYEYIYKKYDDYCREKSVGDTATILPVTITRFREILREDGFSSISFPTNKTGELASGFAMMLENNTMGYKHTLFLIGVPFFIDVSNVADTKKTLQRYYSEVQEPPITAPAWPSPKAASDDEASPWCSINENVIVIQSVLKPRRCDPALPEFSPSNQMLHAILTRMNASSNHRTWLLKFDDDIPNGIIADIVQGIRSAGWLAHYESQLEHRSDIWTLKILH